MMYGYGNGYGYDNMMGGYGWFGGLLMLLFAALVVAGFVLLVIWVVRASSGHHPSQSATLPPANAGHDEAVAVAKRRLAGGEITKEQYEEIMRLLAG